MAWWATSLANFWQANTVQPNPSCKPNIELTGYCPASYSSSTGCGGGSGCGGGGVPVSCSNVNYFRSNQGDIMILFIPFLGFFLFKFLIKYKLFKY